MHNRASDDIDLGVKVNRVVPLWSIVVVVGALIGNGIQSYYNGIEQSKSQVKLEAAVNSLTQKVDTYATNQNAQNLKDAEHDLKIGYINDQIANMRQRMNNIESLLPRSFPAAPQTYISPQYQPNNPPPNYPKGQ